MISGKYLTATLGAMATNIDGTHEWQAQESADRIEATTGANNGRAKKDAGVIETRIRVVFYLDIATGLYAFIRAGTVLTDLKLWHDSAALAPVFAISSATVFDSTVRGQVRGQMIVEAEIEANGDAIIVTDP